MDDAAVVDVGDACMLESLIREREQSIGRPHFAEQYIDGREFNLSVVNGKVLPAAEIDFVDFPPEKPRIVGHRAKWEPESFEYIRTPRRFDFPASDKSLLQKLARLSRRSWNLFELEGYARVDFRVDKNGLPWILEINSNPCLSPDAGFAAALENANIPFATAIEQIINAAIKLDRFALSPRR